MIGKIATGEIEDERDELSSAAAQLGSKGGKKRAENMALERRAEIARKAAEKRWSNKPLLAASCERHFEVQLTTDGHRTYPEAVEGAFGRTWTLRSS
jgi:hypothetical protein